MKELIDSIKNKAVKAVIWRMYNTMVAAIVAILPIAVTYLGIYLSGNEYTLDVFLKADIYKFVIMGVITSLVASYNKAQRVK